MLAGAEITREARAAASEPDREGGMNVENPVFAAFGLAPPAALALSSPGLAPFARAHWKDVA